jgi:hypothetical protein
MGRKSLKLKDLVGAVSKAKITYRKGAKAPFGSPEGGKTQRTQSVEVGLFIFCDLCVVLCAFAVKKTFKTLLPSCFSPLRPFVLSRFRAFALFALFLACGTLAAQEVKLNYSDQKNKQTIRAELYDSYNGDFLMELPLTFHITQDYILFMIVGDDTGIKENTVICLFDKTMELKALEKDKNLKFSGKFKKQYKKVYPFFEQTADIEKLMPFQNNCEYIQKMPKPLFFQIKNYSKPVKLNLKFYIANASGDNQHEKTLMAESGTIKITINIIK